MDRNWRGNSQRNLFNQLRDLLGKEKKCSNYILLKYAIESLLNGTKTINALEEEKNHLKTENERIKQTLSKINELDEENYQIKRENDALLIEINRQKSLYLTNFQDQYNYQCQLAQSFDNQQAKIEVLKNQNLGYKLELEEVKEKIDENEKLKQIIADKEYNLKRLSTLLINAKKIVDNF